MICISYFQLLNNSNNLHPTHPKLCCYKFGGKGNQEWSFVWRDCNLILVLKPDSCTCGWPILSVFLSEPLFCTLLQLQDLGVLEKNKWKYLKFVECSPPGGLPGEKFSLQLWLIKTCCKLKLWKTLCTPSSAHSVPFSPYRKFRLMSSSA